MTQAGKDIRPMRVVIGVDTFPPDINGASRFAERLASGLVRAGHDVHVIAPAYSKNHGTFTEVHDSSSMTVHRIKSYRVVQHKTLRYVWPFTLKAKTDRILKELKPDVVHINSHMIVGRYLVKSAKELGLRVIATNHIMPENLIKYSLVIPRWAEKMVMSLAWKDAGRVLKQADVVTTPTRKAANLLESAANLHGVLAVSCGIDAAKFANNTPTSNKEPTILYLGRLDYEKHIHNLIRAVALLAPKINVSLEIVGDGGEREYLEQLARELGIEKSVHFRGHISDEELPGFYERATVFAMPSIAELQSIATMEAMASGRPVVAADAMALPHLVHDGDNGYLFPPGDIEAFASQLEKVLTADEDELTRLSENSLHLIQSHDINKTIEIFERIYLGNTEEENETSDNLSSYSMPIGRLSKSVSRAMAATRNQSVKLRENMKLARKEIATMAEAAKDGVKDRLGDVSEGFAFAATTFTVRIRKGIRRATDKLRNEEKVSDLDASESSPGTFDFRAAVSKSLSWLANSTKLQYEKTVLFLNSLRMVKAANPATETESVEKKPESSEPDNKEPESSDSIDEKAITINGSTRLAAIASNLKVFSKRLVDLAGELSVQFLKLTSIAARRALAWARSAFKFLQIAFVKTSESIASGTSALTSRLRKAVNRHGKDVETISTQPVHEVEEQLPRLVYLDTYPEVFLRKLPKRSIFRWFLVSPKKLRSTTKKAYASNLVQDLLITSGVILLLFLAWYLGINDPIQAARQEQSAVSVVEEWKAQSNISHVETLPATAPSDEAPPIVGIPALGQAFAAIYIPRFGDDYVRVIAEGTGTDSLNSYIRGVGRYAESDALGDFGNFAIAAHRNAFGAPFSKIDQLRIGDKIYVEIPEGWFEYEYRNTEYVFDSEISVLDSFPRLGSDSSESRVITLTSCHPRFSTAERVIAYGVFQGWYPRPGGAPVELFDLLKRRS